MFLNKGVTAGEVGFSWIYAHKWGKCYFIEVLDFAIGINIKQIFNFCLSALSWHRKGDQIPGVFCVMGIGNWRGRIGFCEQCLFCHLLLFFSSSSLFFSEQRAIVICGSHLKQ